MKKIIPNIKIDMLDTQAKLAVFHERNGELDKASKLAARILKQDAGHPVAQLVSALLTKRAGNLASAKTLFYKLITQLTPLDSESADCHFELGEIHDKLGEYPEALYHWRMANWLQQQKKEYSQVNYQEYFSHLDSLSAHSFRKRSPILRPVFARPPVFMLGFPRSGTTLLHHMLAAHPQIKVMEEEEILLSLVRENAGHQPDMAAYIDDIPLEHIQQLRQKYLEVVTKRVNLKDGDLFIDKLPLMMAEIPLIKRLFPESKIIFSIRHPCDCILSNFRQKYSLNAAMAGFSELDRGVSLYIRLYELWNKYQTRFKLDVLTVKYENLVANTQQEQLNILKFLNISPVSSTLDHTRVASGRFIKTPSYHDVRQPVFTQAIDRWRNYQQCLAWPPEQLKPVISALGYSY